MFEDGPVEVDWFTPSFLHAVSATRVDATVAALHTDFGAFTTVSLSDLKGTVAHGTTARGMVRLERALVPVSVALDAMGRISELVFRAPEPVGTNAADITERIAAVAVGCISVLACERHGDAERWRDRVDVEANRPMAVGSAFKLAVLRAYEDAVAATLLRRDAVIALTAGDRSLPTGVMQTLRPGTPVTLESMVGLMIQHSDNTASDALMGAVGRDALERIAPRNRPFPTTAEVFRLIARDADADRAAFARGTEADRRDVLARLSRKPLPPVGSIGGRPTWNDIEWRFTARELRDLIVSLQNAPALNGIPEPIVAPLREREGWSWIGFKGGSEFGVLNLTAAGVTPDGRSVCAVVTTNGREAQPEDRLALLFTALLRSLARERS